MVSPWIQKTSGTPGLMVADAAEVRRALGIFADPEAACEVMALKSGICRIIDGAKIEELYSAVEALPAGAGIYFRVNPVPIGLEKPANNPDILRRRWLYVDVDPVKAEGFKDDPATDAEKDGTREVCEAVNEFLSGMGWPAPVITDSGNGYGLFFRVDLPNDEDSRDLVKRILYRLAELFSGPKGGIDRSTHNANRLAKLPGTWAKKGKQSDDRPHRPCRLVYVPDAIVAVDRETLLEVAGEPERQRPPSPPKPPREMWVRRADDSRDAEAAYAAAALDGECARVILSRSPADGGEGRNNALNRAAFSLGQLVGGGVLNRATVESRLYDAACRCGLDRDDGGERAIHSTIGRGLDDGGAKPRGVPEREEQGKKSSRWEVPVEPKSDPSKPAIYPLPDLLALDLPSPRWAIPGLLSEGLSILAGKPKLGKSWMALNLGLTVAAGGKALGAIQVQPGDVLYLALEDRLRRIRDRAAKVLKGMKMTPPGKLSFAVEWPRQDRGGVTALAEWLHAANDPRLVIVDVWAKFRAPSSGKKGAYEQDYEQLTEVKSCADHYGCSVLCLHHTRKSAAEDVFDEISGTLGIAGAADGSMVLARSRGKNEGTLAMTGRDIEEQTLAVEFNPETFTWISHGSAEDRLAGDLQKRIVEYLKLIRQPAFTPDIAAHVQAESDTVRKALHRLLEKRILRREGNAWAYPGDDESTVS